MRRKPELPTPLRLGSASPHQVSRPSRRREGGRGGGSALPSRRREGRSVPAHLRFPTPPPSRNTVPMPAASSNHRNPGQGDTLPAKVTVFPLDPVTCVNFVTLASCAASRAGTGSAWRSAFRSTTCNRAGPAAFHRLKAAAAPEDDGSTLGALHRAFQSLREVVSTRDDAAIDADWRRWRTCASLARQPETQGMG